MITKLYKPTTKGIKRGLNADDVITYIDYHYVWLKKDGVDYHFMDGDAFEWKSKLRKPDSLWELFGEIETRDIKSFSALSEYNKDANIDELSKMGFLIM